MGLDRVKRGRGPLVVKTIGGTVLIVLMSTVHSMMKIQKRSLDGGVLNPTDQILFSKHLLEVSLMGNSVILSSFLILSWYVNVIRFFVYIHMFYCYNDKQ